MPKINFIGPSYTLRSESVDCQRTVNMYPDINELGGDKTQLFFTGSPGYKSEIETGGNVRGMFTDAKGDLYVAEGQEFVRYKYDDVDEEGILYRRRTVLGGLYTTTGRVSIAENGFQICVVDGDNLYVYIYADETFQQYEPAGWMGSNVVVYYDTYFVFVERESQKYYISSQYDGTKIDALDFASKENYPDNIVTAISFNNYLWLLGEKTLQLVYNSGDTFPLSNMQGGSANIGCIAKDSVAICSNTLFWLGSDSNGFGTVYMTQGNSNPSKISNFAVDYFLQSQEKLSDATAYAYQEDGHNFYVLNFPSGNTTWVYDFATQTWHERSYTPLGGEPQRHRGEFHTVWKSKHLISDFSRNKIYHQSLSFYKYDDEIIKRYRRSPHMVGGEMQKMYFNEFQLDLEVGNDEVDNAQIFLRYSNDGGKNWSSLLKNSMGAKGNYKARVIWRRLGSARDRVWEVSINDPVKFVLLNAYVR